MNVLFVCLGNICRSPIAEGVLRKYFDMQKIAGQIDSAATADWNIGNPPDHRALKIARLNGIDISQHRARQVHADDGEKFDVIFALDREILKSLMKTIAPEYQSKIRLLLEDNDVPDPYHGNDETYRQTFHLIDRGCRQFLEME